MLRYIMRSLLHYKVQTVSLLLGLLAIELGVCVGLLAMHQAQVSITEDIAQYSRDVYDILVRPASRQEVLLEKNERALLEPNYISKSGGGISLENWQEIKSIPGIDVAAPVAALGYFTNSMDSLQIMQPADKAARLQIEFITSDGYKDYTLGNKIISAIAPKPDSKMPVIVAVKGAYGYSGYGDDKERLSNFSLPPIYNFLVAIDPESESELVGLEYSLNRGQYLSPSALEIERVALGRSFLDAYQVPVLVNAAIPVPLKARIVEEDLEIPPHLAELISQVNPQPQSREEVEFAAEVSALLLEAAPLNRTEYILDLSGYLQAFQTTGIKISPAGEASTTSGGLQHIAPATEYYTTRGIEYQLLEEDETAVFQPIPTGVKDGQVQFHALNAQGKPVMQLLEEGQQWIFQLVPVGEVDFSGLRQNELAKSPLGIYGSEQMLLEEDGDGGRLDPPVELHSTVTPGTLQLPAAHGFTTLEAAVLLKGEAPIDAIRVRVAGVESYDAAGQARIRQVAEEIVARTGLRVDIVAGSSPQHVKIKLPGYENVAPLGTAGTWWLRLGAATVIEHVFSIFVSAMVTAFIAVGLVFVHNRGRIHLWQRREEVAILHAEGWPDRAVIKLFSLEIGLLWLVAAVITGCIGMAAGGVTNASWDVLLTRWLAVAIIGGLLFVGGAYRTLRRSYATTPGQENTTPSKQHPGRREENLPRGGMAAMLRADLAYYGPRLHSMLLQLVLGGALSLFAWLAVTAAGRHLLPTRLGEFIYARAGLWLSVIGLAALLLVLLTCLDSLMSYLDLRRPQLVLLRQLGWQSAHLLKLILPQLLLPVTLAVIIAAVLAGGSVTLLYHGFPVSAWQLLAVCLSFAGLSALLVCGWMHTLPMRDLAEDKARTPAKKLRLAGLTAAVLGIVILVAVSRFYVNNGLVRSDHIDGEASAAQAAIAGLGSEAFNLTRQLVALGHRPAGSAANRQEIDLLGDWIEKAGLEVHREPVTVPPVRGLAPESTLEVGGAAVDFTGLVIDLAAAAFGEPYILKDENPVLVTADMTSETNVTRRLVLIETASVVDFRKKAALYLEDGPLAIVGVVPGSVTAMGPAVLSLKVLEIIPGYTAENIWVDIPGKAKEGEPVWVVTSHGSIGPGASDNAGGAAGVAVLARHLKDNPLPAAIRIMWTAGGDAQYAGGLARYLEQHTPPGPALAVCRLGIEEPAVFGDRNDTLFGRPRDWPLPAEDLAPEDYIKFIDPPPQHRSALWDLDYPYIYQRLSAEARGDEHVPFTPDSWMAAAERVNRELKMGIRPSISTSLGSRLLETGAPTATYFRLSPYSHTKKDTLDLIKPDILGRDIYFLDRVLREFTGRNEQND